MCVGLILCSMGVKRPRDLGLVMIDMGLCVWQSTVGNLLRNAIVSSLLCQEVGFEE